MGKYMDKWLPELKLNGTLEKTGTQKKIMSTNSISDVLGNILKGRSVVDIPRTAEEITDAKARLANYKTFNCTICQDAHFVHPVIDGKPDYGRPVPCQCVRKAAEQKRHDNLLKYCELPPKGRTMTFENFRRSPETDAAYNACLEMAKGENSEPFLMLNGFSNHGKTHLAIAACNYRLERNQLAKYANAIKFLIELREGFKPKADDSYLARFNVFLTVPLLLIDDLGTENETPWAQEQLNYLFDCRLMNQLPTIVTSNLPIKDVQFRIRSRIERAGKVITIKGQEFKK